MNGECMYCQTTGKIRVTKGNGVDHDIYVCDGCWLLLKDPKTALPLIRGHLTMSLRGSIPQTTLDRMLNAYMGMISSWKLRD
jgi:hypothetical protein